MKFLVHNTDQIFATIDVEDGVDTVEIISDFKLGGHPFTIWKYAVKDITVVENSILESNLTLLPEAVKIPGTNYWKLNHGY